MTKEKATKEYYDLIEKCKIEDVDCDKYNMHHIDPLFTLKDKYNAKRTMDFRYKCKDDFEVLKCSIKHHVKLHYFLCFMFERGSNDEKSARHAFWQISGKYIKNKNDELDEKELNEIALHREEISKLNQTHEEQLERDRIYRHSDKVRKRKEYLDSRLCYDPRFDIGGFNYFVGRYVSYGTLYAWAKWEKEQEKNPMFANITVPKFCKQYLIYNDEGNELIFDEHMNDEYRKEYDKNLKERQRKNARASAKQRRQENENVKIKEKENRNKLRHRLCKDPRFNKLTRDGGHRPYEEYTTYYNLYDWATFKLKSDFITDEENAILGDFNKAEDFAKAYLITDENGNYIYAEPKGIISWKSNEEQSKTKFNRENKLCFDPRIHTKTKIVKFQFLYKSLFKYKDFEKLYNSTPLDFAKSCIITDENGNYIYDKDEALIRLNKLGDENFPHLVMVESSQYDITDTIFDL